MDFVALLSNLEAVTSSALEYARANEAAKLRAALTNRRELINAIVGAEQAGQRMTYEEYNRLVVVHVQGQQIQSAIQETRASILDQMYALERDRLFAQRIGGELQFAG